MAPKVIAIVGPTGSGKSALALELARRYDGEIISADSRAVYRGLDIGTAKPTPKERRLVPHYLLDIKNVGETMTVAEFQTLAKQAIADIHRRGKIPFVVGGTMLYVEALLSGFRFPPPGDPELRHHLEQEPDERLRDILLVIDPRSYQSIDLANRRRVIRAIEVALTSGQSFVALRQKQPPPYRTLILGLVRPRDELYRRIDERFEEWIEKGLVDEIRWVLAETSPQWVASLGLHYRWLAAYLQGEIEKEEAIRRSKRSLRDYARRQLAWWRRRHPEVVWVSSTEEAAKTVERFLAGRR